MLGKKEHHKKNTICKILVVRKQFHIRKRQLKVLAFKCQACGAFDS